jgi:DNA-binding NarL/FixJ family response regulator
MTVMQQPCRQSGRARPARVLLADDHAPVARQICALLEPDFDVVAVVENGGELVAAVDSLAPDVIVTDISMPGMDGIAAAATILEKDPGARVVFVTIHCDPATVQKAMAAGAMGYVLKVMAGDELVPAIQSVLQGQRYLSSAIPADVCYGA